MFKLLSLLGLLLLLNNLQGCHAFSEPDKKVASPPVYSVIPAPPTGTDEQTKWWFDRHQQKLEQARIQPVDLLMIGDSITHFWENEGLSTWHKYYQPRNAFNIGIGGDRTEQVLWRLENGALNNMQPKVAVLMIGTNNTGYRMDPADHTAKGIKAIIKELRERLPNTRVLLLAIFPRQQSPNNEMRQRNNAINRQIAILADNKHIYFLNINDSFINQKGELNTAIMPDRLHLNEEGYQVWAYAMEEKIRELMDE